MSSQFSAVVGVCARRKCSAFGLPEFSCSPGDGCREEGARAEVLQMQCCLYCTSSMDIMDS